MENVLLLISVIIVIIGAFGTIVPILPGTPLIFVTSLLYGWYEGFEQITTGTLVILGLLMAVTLVIDYISGIVGAKKYGASRYGTWGSLIGGVMGFIFLNLPGIFLGPLLGAIIGELIAGKKIAEASKVGVGTLIGMVFGSAIKFGIALTMAGLFITRAFF